MCFEKPLFSGFHLTFISFIRVYICAWSANAQMSSTTHSLKTSESSPWLWGGGYHMKNEDARRLA